MNEETKIILSTKERLTITNTDFFSQKRNITEKIFKCFGSIVEKTNHQQLFAGFSFPNGTDFSAGKISRGENYLGLPFVILDFPRKFSTEDVFAIRTMFWWGNFISCTLLLSGNSYDNYRESVRKKYLLMKNHDFFICTNESPWHHHFSKDNFVKIRKLSKGEFEKTISQNPFIKIAARIPLTQIRNTETFAIGSLRFYKEILLP